MISIFFWQLEAAIPSRLPFDFMERAAQEAAREPGGFSGL
jgi:hypothetical protein